MTWMEEKRSFNLKTETIDLAFGVLYCGPDLFFLWKLRLIAQDVTPEGPACPLYYFFFIHESFVLVATPRILLRMFRNSTTVL